MTFKIIIAFLLFHLGFSQDTKMSITEYINFSDLPAKTAATPSWANQFYTNPDLINISNLKIEMNDWIIAEQNNRKEALHKKPREESDKEFENDLKEGISENPIVRFALYFVRKVPIDWIDAAGNLNLPTKNEFYKNVEENEKIVKTINQKSIISNNWSSIGPKEVLQNGTPVVSNTNIYNLSVAPSATNIRLACSEFGALFKTIDGGANWNYFNNYSGPSVFHPTDANKIIIASNPIRLSADGGTSWTTRPIFTTANEVVWSLDGTTILVAAEQGIYVSNNAGATFSQKQTANFMDVEFKPGSSTVAYAITNTGVFYKTTDGGITWVIKPTNYTSTNNRNGFLIAITNANPDIVAIASLTGISPDTGNEVEIIRSTNVGESFVKISATNIDYSNGFYDFVFGISPLNADIYFVGVSSLFKSNDGGLNFNPIGGYLGPYKIHPDIQDLVIFNNTVVVATDGGVSESTDNFTNSANWRSTCSGLDTFDYWGFDQGFNTDQMGGGKYHNGNDIFNPNWGNRKTLFLGGAEEQDGKAIFSRPNSIFYAGPDTWWIKNFKQIDTDYNTVITESYPFSLTNNVLFHGLRNGDIASNTLNSNIIYASKGTNLTVSYDNGLTNQVLKNFNSKVWDIKTTRKNEKVIYVLTESAGLWKTSDGGTNWTVCNMTINNVNLMPSALDCYIDVSQTNADEIWLMNNNSNSIARISKSIDGGQTWINLNTTTLNEFSSRQIINQYGSDGGIYLMGQTNGVAKCYYRNNTLTDWVDYSANLRIFTSSINMFLKASYFQEKLRVAGTMGVQEIPFYEKSKPVAQPTTNEKEVCINQEIKFSDYSILNYTGATWEWSFSKIPIYLNGTTSGSRDPIVKFLSPGFVDATLKVTNNSGISDTKTVSNFINVNYDAASCLVLNSDHDYDLSCVNGSINSLSLAVGSQGLVTNFNGATTGKFLVQLKFYTACYGKGGSLIAIVNLDTNQIKVLRYKHCGEIPFNVLNDNTSTVTSASDAWAQVSFSLINKSLYIKHISSICTSWGLPTIAFLKQDNYCFKPMVSNESNYGDSAELQKCNNVIQPSVTVTNNTDILVSNFANATSGLYYVNVNAFTACNSATNNLKAIVDLNTSTINVLDYKHFESNFTSATTGNETSSVTSVLATNAQVNYFINNKKLYIKKIADPCGGVNFKLNASCWSAMDDDQNGVDNSVEPSNCNNALSTNAFTDGNTHIVKDFSSTVTAQSGVFVKLNITSSCNNTNATIYLSIDFGKNIIHIINYRHFGATTSSTVLNNDSANVYSESSTNGKLKFIFINNALYIQRLSTPCAGSTYQVTNSCYSLASQQVLDVNKFVSSGLATVIAYPNPTKGIFNIDTKTNTDDFNLSFYSIDGKYITPIFEKTDTNILKVNMDQYAEGLYFVILYNKMEDKYNYLKIIKE